MAAAAPSSNPVLNLTTANNQVQIAPSRTANDNADNFSAALTQQLQVRQAQEAAYGSKQTVANTSTSVVVSNATPSPTPPSTSGSPASAEAATSPADAQPGQSAASSDSSTPAAADRQAAAAGAQNASNTSSASTSNAGQTEHAGSKSNASQDDEQGAAQQAAVANAQLQVYVAQGLQFAQADADAKGNGLAKAEGLADMLTSGGDGKLHAHLPIGKPDAAESIDAPSTNGKSVDLAAKLGGERQALPTANGQAQHGNTNFADLLEQRMHAVDPGVVRPQPAMPAVAQRLDATRGSNGGDPLKATGTIYEAVGSDGWDHALGNKMVMMVSNDQQEVELHLNPPHLGPMEVKLSVDQNQANITFVADHAPVREAIEASMPKLTQMMAESGIQLTQSNVQARNQGSGGQSGQSNRRGGASVRAIDMQEPRANAGSWRAGLMSGLPGNVNLFV